MSEPVQQQFSFLHLVPTYRRVELLDNEQYVLRRYSSASSVVSFASSVSMSSLPVVSSTGYGPNGFLILTSSIDFDTVDDDEEE